MSQNTPPLFTPELPPDPLRPDQQGPPPPPSGPPPLPRMSDWLRRGRVAGAEQAAADLTNDEVMRRVTAGTQGPADAAELAQVAQELGLDPQHLDVGGDKGEVLRVARETLARRQVRSQDFARNYPGMARVLASVPWAPIARDDLNNLASTETRLGLLHAAWNRGRAETDLGYLGSQLAAARAVRGGEGLSEAQQRELQDLDPDLLFRYQRMRERLQALPEPTGLVSSAFAGVAEMLAQQARVLPAVAAAGLAGTAVAGPVGGFTGGLGTAFAQSAAIEGGSFYMDMRSQGYTHDEALGPSIVVAAANGALEVAGELAFGLPVARAAARTLAIRREMAKAVAGEVKRAVIGEAPKAANKLLKETFGGVAKEAGKEYLLAVGGESATEAAQDIVSAVWEEVVRLSSTDDMRAKIPAQSTGGIVKRAVNTGLQMVKTMALFGALAPGYSFFRQAARIRAAENFGKALANSAKIAAESKVRGQDPNAYADAANQVSRVPTLYVDPKALTEVLAHAELEKPGTTAAFHASLPDVAAQIEPALRDGELVEIPTGDYLGHIVNSPVQQELDQHLVPDPDAMSPFEAAEKKKLAALFAQSVEGDDAKAALRAKTAEEKAAAKKWDAGVKVVRERIEEQLRAAVDGELGNQLKITRKDIPHLGRMLSAMYSSLAKAWGVTPEEALQRRPVSIAAQGVSVGAGEQLSAAARAVTETPEFKAWFGDSKVVDAEGKPLVVYHGTSSDFAEFSAGRSGSNTGNPNARLGFFFSNSPSEASRYATDFGKGSGGRVSPVFLAIRNPYKMPYREFDDLAMAEYRGLRDMVVKGAPTEEQAARIAAVKREANSAASARRDELIAAGYDGVVVNIGGGQEFIAFHPEQIKSVNNRGTFDANSPNILEQLQSTRVPTGKKPTGDPHTELMLQTLSAMRQDTKAFAQNVAAIRKLPFLRLDEAATDEQVAEAYVQHVVDNLDWLYNQMSPADRERSRLWYDGGRKFVEKWADRYGLSTMQAAAIVAVLSPQKDWFVNMTMAERMLDIAFAAREHVWDDAMTKVANRAKRRVPKPQGLKAREVTKLVAGKSLAEVMAATGDRNVHAYWIRIYDQAHNSAFLAKLTPEGGSGGRAAQRIQWAPYGTMAKVLSILEDGSAANVSQQLGAEAKVRNFYNNLWAPNAQDGFVTIDTHAVAAAYLLPLSSENTEVTQVWGGAGTAAPANSGLKGLYPLMAEAYRRAGAKYGLLPREMQSITWEQVRAMFTAVQKRDTKRVAAARSVWARYRAGELTAEQARAEVLKTFGGFERPFWEDLAPTQALARTYEGRSATEQDKAKPRGRAADPTKVMLEVKPNRNPELLKRWEKLTREQRARVTQQVLAAIVPQVLREAGTNGEVVPQRGAWEGSPEESIALVIDDPRAAVRVADALGLALYQEGMFVMSLKPGAGLAEGQAVAIHLPAGYTTEQIDKLYTDVLWPIRGAGDKRAVVGHSTQAGVMLIGVDPAMAGMTADELKARLHAVLDDTFAASVVDLHTAFRSHEDYAKPSQELPAAEPPAARGSRGGVGEAADAAYRAAFAGIDAERGAGGTDRGAGGDQLHARQLGAYDLKLAQILLRPGATPITVLHEMMHFYVDNIMSSTSPEAQRQADVLLKFWGITREQWDAMSFKEREPLHEAISYNWERYLGTGEAPSAELKGVFQRIILWFRRAYQSIRDVAALYQQEFDKPLPELSLELRRFFDLLLATDDQVSMAESARQHGSVFLTKEQALSIGVTEEQWQEYQQLRDAQHAAAVGAVTVDALKNARWLRAAVLKSEAAIKSQIEKARTKIRKEVEQDVRGRPVYHAAEQLRTGTIDTGDGVIPLRVDPDTLSGIRWVDGASQAFAGMLKDGGVPADVAAAHLGFASGDEMFRAIFNAEPIEQVVDRETEERFQNEEVFADPERMRDAVAKAVQGELRGRVLAAEMKMLTASQKPARLTQAAAKDAAGRLLGRTLVKDIDARRVMALEARAAVRARQAVEEGKTDDAIVAMRQQLVFHELAKMVVSAQQELRTAITAVREMLKAPDLKTAKKRSMPLVQAARAILAAWGIGDPAAPAQFLELLRTHDPVTAASIDGEIAPWIAKAPRAPNARTPGYSQAPLADFWAMIDQVKLLWHRAERDMSIRTENGRVAADTAGAEIVEKMLPIYGDAKAVRPLQKKERKGFLYRFAGAALKRTEHWVRMVDGGPDGPVHRYMWRPLRKAYDAYLEAHEGPYKAMHKLLKALDTVMTGAAVAAPEIGYTFSSDYEMLGALQNMGNASNLGRVLDSYGWGARDAETGELDTSRWWDFVQKAMKDGRIRKEHLDYLQAVWDFNEKVLAPQSQKAMLDLFGVFWKPVGADAFETPWGTYRGGYTPIKLDPMLNHGLRIDVTLDSLREMETTMRQSMPGSKPAGHTIDRVAQSSRPILLDIRVQLQHIDEVLRFVHLQPAIRDVATLLKNKTFQTYANAVDPTIIRGMLMPMLEATARNQITTPPESPAVALRDRVLNAIRINTGVRIMFGAVRIALQQLSGVSNANQYVRARHLMPATFYALTNVVGSTREALRLSANMRLRLQNKIGNTHQDIEVLMDPERFSHLTQFANRYGYILQALIQGRTDVATWHGAFAQSLEEQGADKTDEAAVKVAVDHADEAVRLSQGSNTPIDVAGYERASAIWRLLQQFSSYPNLVLNQVAGARGAGPKTMAIIRAMIVPTFIAAAVTALLAPPKDFDDENGDGDTLDEYLKFFAGEQVKGGASLLPVVGPMLGSLLTRQDRRAVDRVTPAPAWSLLATSIPRVYGFVEDTVKTGEVPPVDGAFIRALTDVVGLTTGGVFAPLGRIAAYAADVQSGKTQPPSTASFVRGLVTGR